MDHCTGLICEALSPLLRDADYSAYFRATVGLAPQVGAYRPSRKSVTIFFLSLLWKDLGRVKAAE